MSSRTKARKSNAHRSDRPAGAVGHDAVRIKTGTDIHAVACARTGASGELTSRVIPAATSKPPGRLARRCRHMIHLHTWFTEAALAPSQRAPWGSYHDADARWPFPAKYIVSIHLLPGQEVPDDPSSRFTGDVPFDGCIAGDVALPPRLLNDPLNPALRVVRQLTVGSKRPVP